MKISFCTAVCNRLHQLSQTFDHNSNIILENPNTEWVILNFGSDDGLHEYMISKLKYASERIIYANETSKRKWHMSAGKNSAHSVASGEVFVNLDCDNFIHKNVDFISERVLAGIKIMRTWSGVRRDGTCGRIAVTKSVFEEIGGYDESFYPAGYQDTDFFERAILTGVRHETHVSSEYKAIRNEKTDTVKNTGVPNLTWSEMNRANRLASANNIVKGILVANLPNGFYIPKVEIFRGVVA